MHAHTVRRSSANYPGSRLRKFFIDEVDHKRDTSYTPRGKGKKQPKVLMFAKASKKPRQPQLKNILLATNGSEADDRQKKRAQGFTQAMGQKSVNHEVSHKTPVYSGTKKDAI